MTDTGRAGTAPLGALIEASPALIFSLRVDGTVNYANPASVRAFGHPGGLLGRPVDELFTDDSGSGNPAWLVPLLRAADPQPLTLGERLARRSDGSTFPVDALVVPLELEGEPSAVVILRDLSERIAAEQRLAELGRAYRTLAALNEAVVRARDDETLFAELCRVAVQEGGYYGVWVGQCAEVDGAPRVVPVAWAGDLEGYVAGLVIPLDPTDPRGRGPTATAFLEGRPVFANDFLEDTGTAPWHRAGSAYGIRSSGTLPVFRGGRVHAALTLYSAQPGAFDADSQALLQQLTANVSFALDSLAAARASAELAQQRAALAARLLAAEEAERNRIAADVHDEPVQALAAVELRLGLLERRLSTAAPELVESAAAIRVEVGEVITGLRELLYELEPASATATVEDLLCEACAHVFEHTGIDWRVDVVGAARGEGEHYLDPTTCGEVLRIVREALINARKHADATRVEVGVSATPDLVEVAISDDGRGIPADATTARGHRGLATMSDRASAIGARLEIVPGAGGGTVVRVAVPRACAAGEQPVADGSGGPPATS
jgi:PAS domain S-box-containing protein